MLTPRNGSDGETIKLEPNSKPFLLKRLISDGFDTALVFMLFIVLVNAILNLPLADAYHGHTDNANYVQESIVKAFGDDTEAINSALKNNAYYQNERFAANLHSFLFKLLAGFIAETAVLLIVPLFSKKRQTPGKMLTGVMPFCERKLSKATRLSIFGRFLFIFFIDSAFLYSLTGIATFLLVPVLRLIEMLINKKNKTICDFFSGVMIIEQLSYNGIN